ncbi:putative PEP-binding protein [Vibrio sp. WXL103]|uniref:putative PEP-binding protein n=1 Tax=Vibrio sp. WXL103 TaxID=3450710 RepID=UPI003EC50B01
MEQSIVSAQQEGQFLPSAQPSTGAFYYFSLGDWLQQAENIKHLQSAESLEASKSLLIERIIAEVASVAAKEDVLRVSLDKLTSEQIIAANEESAAKEANPLMGVRGVARYAAADYQAWFQLECELIKALREQFANVTIVVPFVRSLADAARIIDKLAEQGLPRGLNGLKVLFSVNVPSSALLAERLLHYFDGLVIDSEDLTQFTLGVDKHNPDHQHSYAPDNESVVQLINIAYQAAQAFKKPAILLTEQLATNRAYQLLLSEQPDLNVVVTA